MNKKIEKNRDKPKQIKAIRKMDLLPQRGIKVSLKQLYDFVHP